MGSAAQGSAAQQGGKQRGAGPIPASRAPPKATTGIQTAGGALSSTLSGILPGTLSANPGMRRLLRALA